MLKSDIKKAIAGWDERSMFDLKGTKLSRADLDALTLYADAIEQYGTYDICLMPPVGAVAEVLKKYGMV